MGAPLHLRTYDSRPGSLCSAGAQGGIGKNGRKGVGEKAPSHTRDRETVMTRKDYYRWMFVAGALWNWVATLVLALGYRWIFPLFGMTLPRYPVFFLLFLALAFVYGIGYYWVSRDLDRNHDIVRLGILGKILVFIGLGWGAAAGDLSFLLAGAGLVDLVFACLYMEFLHWVGNQTERSRER